MQIAQDISLRMYVKKRRRSGLRRGFLACIIREIAKSRCVSYFLQFLISTTGNENGFDESNDVLYKSTIQCGIINV